MSDVLSIIGHMADGDLDWMAKAGQHRRVESGAVLIHQGVPVETLFVVLDGTLDVTVEGVGKVAALTAGQVAGEMSLIDAAPPSATVTPHGSTFVLSIPKATLEAKIAESDAFAARFYKALALFLSARLRATLKRASGSAEAEPPRGLDDDRLAAVIRRLGG